MMNTELVASGYGQTESHSATNCGDYADSTDIRWRGVGRPVWYNEMKIVDIDTGKDIPPRSGIRGEDCFRGLNNFIGYYKDPEKTREVVDKDGWVHMGDLAYQDEYGYLHVLGRIRDIIRKGDDKFTGDEVEDIINRVPGVKLSCVVGIPDETYGQVAYAMVSPLPGVTLTEEQIMNPCREKLPVCAVPEYIEFITDEELTSMMTSTGKFLRKQAAERCAKKIGK
jgi:fatty-acyl-CoA synthase